jgi:hypothetical protein
MGGFLDVVGFVPRDAALARSGLAAACQTRDQFIKELWNDKRFVSYFDICRIPCFSITSSSDVMREAGISK